MTKTDGSSDGGRGQPGAAARWRLVIFDFDGTLADSFPWFAGVLSAVAARWRIRPVGPEEIELLRQAGHREILRHLQVPGWKAPLVARDLRRRMTADIHHIRPFADVDALLRALHGAGIELAIATSNSADNVRAVLGPQALRRFRHLETGVAIHGKGARLRRLLRRTGVPAAAAVYIGDELRDIEAARAAGVTAAAVTWGYNRAEALRRAGPDLVFERIEDIQARLFPDRDT